MGTGQLDKSNLEICMLANLMHSMLNAGEGSLKVFGWQAHLH